MKKIILLLFAMCSFKVAFGQSQPDTTKGIRMPAKIENGDTVVIANLDEITIPTDIPKPVFESKREIRRYSRLIYNIKKVYPYAKEAKLKYVEMIEHLKTLNTEKERNAYTKQLEKEILGKYEAQIKDMTRAQGILLNKLIYREIDKTSYDLLKEFRGRVPTFFYQTLARIFGINLKIKYDPTGEDKPIEDILVAIDAGLI
jgi:hypothetical protein